MCKLMKGGKSYKNYKPWKRGRGGGNKTSLAPLRLFLMYVNLFSGVALMTKILS